MAKGKRGMSMVRIGLVVIGCSSVIACSTLPIADMPMPGGGDSDDAVSTIDPGFKEPFNYFDQNADGFISSGEYFNRRRSWFLEVDEDEDGLIANACGSPQEAVTFERCAEFWTEEFAAAAAGDAFINFDEFTAAR